jgi:type IX secretion system PorP/SprF family membrane protein
MFQQPFYIDERKSRYIFEPMKFKFLIIAYTIVITLYGQDPQFSQFYNASLMTNPSFAGTIENSRANVSYRNQWPLSGNKSYSTYLFSMDHFCTKIKSGLGLNILQSNAGDAKLKSTEISGVYNFQIFLNERYKFIPSISMGLIQRSIDFNALIFPDQFNNNGYTGQASMEPNNTNNKMFIDIGAGGLIYNEKIWMGFSIHHLNKPNQSINNKSNEYLPMKLNLHFGAKIMLDNSYKGRSTQVNYIDKAIMPSILYKLQGEFDQLDFGANLLIEPMVMGVYYRGIPVKNYSKNLYNNESVNLMLGYTYKNITFNYSYDYVISKLSNAIGGAHEVSIVLLFGKEKIPTHHRRRIPCPTFYHQKLFN